MSHNLKDIHYLIATLIHPDYTGDKISNFFPLDESFYNDIIRVASSYLVLPSVYKALIKKKLDKKVSIEFISYLKSIYEINHERNVQILKQIKILSKILNKNNINHVFLKGAAMLLYRPNNSLKERMIGDIDILVLPAEINKAREILLKSGYDQEVRNEVFLTEGIKDEGNRHIKRLNHNKYIASVELHRNLLYKSYNSKLYSEALLSKKIILQEMYNIPSVEDMWKHTIYNWEINDWGYKFNKISFRSILDIILLEKEVAQIKKKLNSKELIHFYNLMSVFYDIYPKRFSFKKNLFILKMKSSTFRNILHKINKIPIFINLIFNRFFLFMSNNLYRNRVINNRNIIFKKISKIWNSY